MDWFITNRIEWTDILALNWKIDILEYISEQGDITSIQASGEPLIIENLSSSDHIIKEPIKGSIASFTIYSDSNFQWLKFADNKSMKYKVHIYYDSDIYWKGFISSSGHKEPYDGISYPVTITASDCLGLLKTIKYDNLGIPYNGRYEQSKIIFDILGRIWILDFNEFINIYDVGMDSDIDDSPLDQAYLDRDLFNGMNCYEVLEIILKSYNAIIKQKDGILDIYRPFDLINDEIDGRYFSGYVYKDHITKTPDQLLSRTGAITNISDVEGGGLFFQDPAKKITMHQDFGNKESWIDNWKFSVEDYNSNIAKFKNWINIEVEVQHISTYLAKEENGCALVWSGSGTPSFIQTFGVNSKQSINDKFIIELSTNWFNNTGAADAATNLTVFISQNGNWLTIINETTAVWTTTPTALFSYLPIDIYGGTDIPEGFGDGWINIKREFEGLDDDSDIVIDLGAQAYADIYNCYKDIKFYASNYQILEKKLTRSLKQRIIWNSGVDGSFISLRNKYYSIKYKEAIENIVEDTIIREIANDGLDLDFDYVIGDIIKSSSPAKSGDVGIDNILEQFAGAITIDSGGDMVETKSWQYRIATCESKRLLDLIADELSLQYSKPKQLLQLPIMESGLIDKYPSLDITGNIQDSLNKLLGSNLKFALNKSTFDVRNRTWNCDLLELIEKPKDLQMCFIRNKQMDNLLSLSDSLKLAISDKTGLVLTIPNLPNYIHFDEDGWVAMLCDADKTSTSDPNSTGDYNYKEFCTIDREAKTLTFETGTVLTAWEVNDNLLLYNPFLNYEFVGDQSADALIPTSGAPTWRQTYSLGGGIFKDSSGVYKWFIMGYNSGGSPAQTIGYAYSSDMINWTMGNSDLPIIVPADIDDCNGVVISGNINQLADGSYYSMLGCGNPDGRILLRVVYFNEDFTSITFGDVIFDIAATLDNIHPSICKIGSEYHISFYTRVGTDLTTSELTFAKSSALDGEYVPYQFLLKGEDANDGMPYSNNADTSCIFEMNGSYYCWFGATGKWSPGGLKGNREFCLAKYNQTSGIWTIDRRSPIIINPLYWYNLTSSYQWCSDHIGSSPSIFINGSDIYFTCSMTYGSNAYKATILKLNRF